MAAHVQRRWVRDYPPLLSLAAGLLLLLAALPSSLNLPQSNPTETLEYAPIPPDDQTPPPPVGNFASLGLAGSASVIEGTSGDAPPPKALGKTPSTKRCVGNPPRQTSDPLAPPCVAHFQGDNFGATYQGVTRDEVRIVIYVTGIGNAGTRQGAPAFPQRKYYDLGKPPAEDEPFPVQHARVWQRYFNERYQTYGRFVRFFVYFPSTSTTPEERRADAADNHAYVNQFVTAFPFPTLNIAAYVEVAAPRGVVLFSSAFGLAAADYRRFPRQSWGYMPSLEEQAAVYSSYLCTKVAGYPVNFSGNPDDNGKPRKFGLLYNGNAATGVAHRAFKDLVKKQVAQQCDMRFALERPHPYSGPNVDSRTSGDYAAEAMATFRQQGITTIIWPWGYETNFSKAAAALQYRPEWILAGDGIAEGILNSRSQEQSVWRYALTVTPQAHLGYNGVSEPCENAYREVDPHIPNDTLDLTYACLHYNGLRQLFTGIQVAGPRLGPTSMDRGFHAIPPRPSTHRAVPSCFFNPNDYTCVKDATVFRWDPEGSGPETAGAEGCQRLIDNGARFYAGKWPKSNVNAVIEPEDPCHGSLGGFFVA